MSIFERYEQFKDKTFGEAAEKYLSEFRGDSLARQNYALQHVLPYIGNLPLIDIDDIALHQYKLDRVKVAMAGTINKEITTVTTVLNKAARSWRWIPTAPLLERVDGDTRQPYPLSWQEQIDVLFRICGDLQLICLLIVNTGLRREEVFKLRWDEERDVDGVKLFILRDTKNGQDRPVILNSIARRVVDYFRPDRAYWKERIGWAAANGKEIWVPENWETHVIPPQPVNKTFNEAWILAGLPDDPLIKKGVHNLRHTFGHRLRAAGVPAEDRDALLGHHNKSLTQHYALPTIQRLGEHVERITVRDDVAVLR